MPAGTRLAISINLRKTNDQIARLHANIHHQRQDWLHKNTTRLCRENQAVVLEDLSVQGMTAAARGSPEQPGKKVRQKAGLNRSILDVAFGEFRRHMDYKAALYGAELIVAAAPEHDHGALEKDVLAAKELGQARAKASAEARVSTSRNRS